MIKFKADSAWPINGCLAFTTKNPKECDDFDWLIGQEIEVDGKKVVVRDVERFMHMPPFKKGEIIGILTTTLYPGGIR